MKLVNTIHLQGSSQRWILSEISQSRILCLPRMEQVWEPQCRMKRVFTSESRLLSPGVSINLRADLNSYQTLNRALDALLFRGRFCQDDF